MPNFEPPELRCIVVDDHESVRNAVCMQLSRLGWAKVVASASDGEQALALITEHVPDVAILDGRMPHKTGFEVIREFRARALPTLGVLFSALPSDGNEQLAREVGAHAFLAKSNGMGPLCDVLREIRQAST